MAFQGEPQSTRQRMRPWLENRINSGEIPGLEWIDKTQLIFKVPWKHVGNREWREGDSQIFKVAFSLGWQSTSTNTDQQQTAAIESEIRLFADVFADKEDTLKLIDLIGN